jgi:hypothetical protein
VAIPVHIYEREGILGGKEVSEYQTYARKNQDKL